MNEGDDLYVNLSCSTTILIVGKQTDKATSIPNFCLSIPLLPALPSSGMNSGSQLSRLGLFIIMVMLWVNNSIAEDSCCKIDIACTLKQFSTFWSNARGFFRWSCNVLIVLSSGLDRGTRHLACVEYGRAARL